MKSFIFAVLASLLCFSYIIVDAQSVSASASVSIDTGVNTKRSIFSTSANGATTIMVTRRTTDSKGQDHFSRIWYRVSTSPVVRVSVRKDSGSFSLVDNTISAFNATAHAHSLWMSKFVLYSDTNGVAGLQLDDTIVNALDLTTLNIIGLTWSSSVNSWTTSDNVLVYNVSVCGTTPVGNLCFFFHTGNGTYVWNGATVYAGILKIDMSFVPTVAFSTLITSSTRASLVAHFLSSNDVINNGTLTASAASQGSVSTSSTSVTFNAAFTMNFTSGDQAFIDYNKTCVWTYANGSSVDVNVMLSTLDITSSLTASLGFSGTVLGSLNVEGSLMRQLFVFNFMQDLPISGKDSALASIAWDPSSGVSDSSYSSTSTTTTGGKAANFATTSPIVLILMALVSAYFARQA